MSDDIEFPVERVHVLLFARAVGDERPLVGMEGSPSGSSGVVPPTFTEARQQFISDYPWRPSRGRPWIGSGATASGTGHAATGEATLHAEQHFTYVRHPRVGDRLTAHAQSGEAWTKTNSRGHVLEFQEVVTEFRDAAGELVVVSTAVGVTTVVSVEAK
jgi:peroxisomal enoyl-CoA hydratase 2